jgi:hypothetical protein
MNYVLLSQKSVLSGAHALPGCNTTSSFFGNGKKLVYKIMKDAISDFHDLDKLGDPDKDVAISCSSRFAARLYDQKKSFVSPIQGYMNERFYMILILGKNISQYSKVLFCTNTGLFTLRFLLA